MILYVNGDSNSCGVELTDKNLSWPVVLSNQLDLKLINQAKTGASNPRILRVTQEFIEQNYNNLQDYFIVIGWTGWEREEWLHNGVYYDVNSSGRSAVPKELVDQYKEWVVNQNQELREYKSLVLQENIFKLHQELCSLKVKHLFFNALMPFLHNTKVSWEKNYLGPYTNELSYYWYLKNHGWHPTKNNHYLEDAQIIWASVLKNYIGDNKLL